jgi:hypothetical protein
MRPFLSKKFRVLKRRNSKKKKKKKERKEKKKNFNDLNLERIITDGFI